MLRLLQVAIVLFLSAASAIAADFNCMEGCFRQGYARSHCLAVCDSGGPGMLDQPGLPKNPAFDQMQRQTQPRGQPLPPVVDPRCLDDCRKKGFNYSLCRRQCSY
jgi:hypothetical protein